jgi:hypothetical protein
MERLVESGERAVPRKRERSPIALTRPSETAPPSWTQLPPLRRRRLVAVLGGMVLRQRSGKGSLNEPS